MEKIQAVPISWQAQKVIKGKVIFYSPRKKQTAYKNKIVVINDLNLSEIIFSLKRAKAAIAQQGGITNHGANLAREYKIPCLVLPQAKKILKENEKIILEDSGAVNLQRRFPIHFKRKPYRLGRKELPQRRGWFLVRTYARSYLESYLAYHGIEETPQVLFGTRKKAKVLVDRKGKRWVKNHPTEKEIAQKIIDDYQWFLDKVRERRELYQKIKRYTKKLVEKINKQKLSLKEWVVDLEKIQEIYIKRRPYTALTQHPLDYIEKYFYNLASSFLQPSLIAKLSDLILKTEYARAIAKKRLKPIVRKKRLIFPAPRPTYIEARINYKKKLKLSQEIIKVIRAQPQEIQKRFFHYLKIISLLTKLSDETAYLRRTLRLCLNYILEEVGKYLQKKGRIKRVREVLNYQLKDLIILLREEIKRTTKPESLRDIFKRDQRIKKVYNLARKRFKESPKIIVHHSFDHTLRVLYRAILIAKTERDVDYFILVPAVLLHDVGVTTRKDGRHHSQNSVILSKKFLPRLGYSKREIDHICSCIATHGGFSVKRRKEPESLEAKILWDADALERSSKAAAFYVYGIFFEKQKDLDKFVRKRIASLKRTLKRGFYTKKAKEINNNGVKELLKHYQNVLESLKKRRDFLIREDNFNKFKW